MTNHDKGCSNRGDVKYVSFCERVATLSHFSVIKGKEGAFKEEIIKDLPFIEKTKVELTNMAKGQISGTG